MRRSSTRKTGPPNPSASVNSSSVDLFRSASSKAITKELERIDHLFNSYANSSSGTIDVTRTGIMDQKKLHSTMWILSKTAIQSKKYTLIYLGDSHTKESISPHLVTFLSSSSSIPEGIEALCSDVEVDHTDVRILMLAWKMKSEKQGYFTLDEWRRGLKSLRADTISKLKKALPELEKEVRRPQNFVDFYSYSFQYCLTEEKQKSIDIESICELLDLVLGSEFRPQIDFLIEYLKNQNDYKVINMDQWMGFLRFCNEISFPDLNNYDPSLAWPLILDNFVEWMRAKGI